MSTPSPLTTDENLFRNYQPTLVRVVSSTVNASQQTIEDACAFAWMQLLVHRPMRNRTSWLVRVALREAWRLTAEEWRVAADEQATQVVTAPTLADDQRIAWVDGSRRFNALNAAERQLLLMAAAGYSYAEIGELLGHTRRAVERRLKRARLHLTARPQPSVACAA